MTISDSGLLFWATL